MVTIYYWHRLSKRFAIRIALPHLLLSVMAAAFSLSDQNTLPVNQQQSNIIAIASVMVNLHEHKSKSNVQSQSIVAHQKIAVPYKLFSVSLYNNSVPVIRLTPDNGIRAGPSPFLA